jgi:hypothetical protein
MDIGSIHDFLLLMENKQQVSWHTPTERDQALHRASMDLFWVYCPIYGEDATAKKALDPFVTKFNILGGNSVGGLITLPSNFGHLLSGVAVSYNNQVNPATEQPYGSQYWPIEFVNDDELPFRLASQIKPISGGRPVAVSAGGGIIQLYPQAPNAGWITYLQIPTPPVYAYTTPGDPRVLVYNSAGSTQLQWNDSFVSKIIQKALVYLGVNMDDPAMIQLMSQLFSA